MGGVVVTSAGGGALFSFLICDHLAPLRQLLAPAEPISPVCPVAMLHGIYDEVTTAAVDTITKYSQNNRFKSSPTHTSSLSCEAMLQMDGRSPKRRRKRNKNKSIFQRMPVFIC